MKLGYLLALAGWPVALALSGCDKLGTTAGTVGTNARPVTKTIRATNLSRVTNGPAYHLDHAQPKLPTVRLWVGPEVLETEIAMTVTQVMTGMMFREKMGENEAMIFVFGTADQRSFYMKNCKVGLSAAYIDPEGTILEIVPLNPGVETPVPSASDHVQYVLEVNQGWFDRHHIAVGSVIRTERGTLRDTFAGRAVLP